jgi:hypothetical protein
MGSLALALLRRTIEKFSHSNPARLTPHAGPTRHLFLEVDRVEGL